MPNGEEFGDSAMKFQKLQQFEYKIMPLKKISLKEFDEKVVRVGKKDTSGNLVATLPHIVSSFDDGSGLADDLQDKSSVLYGLITDPLFKTENEVKPS